MLVKYINDKKEQWDQFLDMCIYAYNTSQHDSTHFSPYEIMFGRKAVLPIDLDTCRDDAATILQQFNSAPRFSPSMVESAATYRAELLQSAKENILKAQEKQKENYDRKYCKPGTYEVGAQVLLRDLTRRKRKHGKMDLKWNGPYVIMKSLGNGLYSIKDKGGVGQIISRVNGYHLKPFDADSDIEVSYSTLYYVVHFCNFNSRNYL